MHHAPSSYQVSQPSLFTPSMLPTQISRFKSELEDDFLPPRERALLERQYALMSKLRS